MSDSDPDGETEAGDGRGDPAESGASRADLDRTVERSFTCSLCGFATTYEVELLRGEVQSVCVNCNDWTLQSADPQVVADAAREAAGAIAGPILTERQALAYLLRNVVGMDRQMVAEAMESSPSNVDNLQRKGAEKVDAAERLVAELETLTPTAEDSPGE